MAECDFERILESMVSIASELFRFQRVFEKAASKLELEERSRYMSQFNWFAKRVTKAMDNINLRIIDLEGQPYDSGMAITPLNLDEFALDDDLFVMQMMEPVIMKDDTVIKAGTAILGRVENNVLHRN